MCKVFLQHLSALCGRAAFPRLWLRVVRVQAGLVQGADDALTEAALESLKNMILVMDSVRIFSNGDAYNELWYMTWEKIGEFLPNLKDELFPQVKEATTPSVPSHMQPPVPLQTLIPVPNSTPQTLLSSPPMSQPTLVSPAPLPAQAPSPSPPALGPSLAHSPVSLGQAPPALSSVPTLVTPTPITPGMVPIRNSLYEQTGLSSSVLLQPLNEMISTPIAISIQSQMPILYPQTTTELLQTQTPPTQPIKTEPNPNAIETTLVQSENVTPEKDLQHGELYAEYLTNPYHETKDLATKEATLYDPESLIIDQTVPNQESELRNPLLTVLEKQKSLSANATPMHSANKAQFGSSDNVRQESGMFNFTSYFGAVNERSSELFDALLATNDG